EKVTWVRIGALIINIAAVIYLLYTKRLFGLRGGHEAYMAERHEANLLEVEEAAGPDATAASDATAAADADGAADAAALPHPGNASDTTNRSPESRTPVSPGSTGT